MVIVICNWIVCKLYIEYFFGVSPDICIDIRIDINPTSALICIDIHIDIHPTTASIFIYIHIINIYQ